MNNSHCFRKDRNMRIRYYFTKKESQETVWPIDIASELVKYWRTPVLREIANYLLAYCEANPNE